MIVRCCSPSCAATTLVDLRPTEDEIADQLRQSGWDLVFNPVTSEAEPLCGRCKDQQ